jgi:hypothetical protein
VLVDAGCEAGSLHPGDGALDAQVYLTLARERYMVLRTHRRDDTVLARLCLHGAWRHPLAALCESALSLRTRPHGKVRLARRPQVQRAPPLSAGSGPPGVGPNRWDPAGA